MGVAVSVGVGVSVMVGVIVGVGEGTVAVGVNVAVGVGVLVAKMDLKGLPDPVTTLMMMKIPASANIPANPPSTYGIYRCRFEYLLITF